MAAEFQYPPDVFELLIETIPRLCRSKNSVFLFLQGAGIPHEDLSEVKKILQTNPTSINKFEIVRSVLVKLNTRGDSGLRSRRELIKRVVEFESFETCWPEDQFKAKGLVASVREAVQAKDAFTRMQQERIAERERLAEQRLELRAPAIEMRAKIQDIDRRLSALFALDDRPQERGKLLEAVLNDLFKIHGILLREDFRRKDPDTAVVMEQIDGVIELGGYIHLVEMKWLNKPVGVAEFSPHLVRLYNRSDARGIFIATNGYTEPVIKQCIDSLSHKTLFLCSLQEIVFLLKRQGNLLEFFKKKSDAAMIEKNPFLEILI